jgi:hypothetical protein
MYNGAESIEHINAYHQELGRRLDRVAREIDIERMLSPTNADHGADLGALRPAGIVAAIAGWFRPRRLQQQPGD